MFSEEKLSLLSPEQSGRANNIKFQKTEPVKNVDPRSGLQTINDFGDYNSEL